jgi:hypothetical protein
MRRVINVFGALVAGGMLACGPAFAQTADDAALIARGEYLAKAGDCMPCHSADPKAKPFAGGLGLNTPFGVIFSPNITSDRSTGIGDWTYDQFVNAVRNGIRADGATSTRPCRSTPMPASRTTT